MIANPFQPLIDWLSAQFDAVLAAMNPINLMIAMAQSFASLLPAPNPAVADIFRQASSAVDTVVSFVGLADYFVNLPVMLVVVGIILVSEAGINIFRGWRIIRSTIT